MIGETASLDRANQWPTAIHHRPIARSTFSMLSLNRTRSDGSAADVSSCSDFTSIEKNRDDDDYVIMMLWISCVFCVIYIFIHHIMVAQQKKIYNKKLDNLTKVE